jgi:DNA-binding response OmpR family regulator
MINIMMVDDEKGICDFTADFFRRRGHKFTIVNNPSKAMDLIAKETPQIIFLDILMAPINGLDLLRKIRAVDKKVKIVMITVEDRPEVEKESLNLGADDFVGKPFTTEYLEQIVMKKIAKLV